MVVYADILVIVNFIVDYFLLKASAAILHLKPPLLRQLSAAAIGGLSSLYIFAPDFGIFIGGIYRAAVCALMVLCGFGFKSPKCFLRAAGVLTNVVCDIQKWGRWQDEKLLQGRMEKDANGVALEGCGRGCHIAYVDNVKPGERYGIQFRMKGEGSSTVYWQRDRRWDWKLPGTPAVFGEPDAEGWRLGEALVRVPQGANRLALQLGAHQRAGERVVFRDVAVYRLNP